MTRGALRTLAIACVMTTVANAQFVPGSAKVSRAVQSALDAPSLREDERRDLRIRHGQWMDADLDTPARKADAALRTWQLHDASLEDPSVPVELRAEALRRRGRAAEAVSLLAGCASPAGALVRAQCLDLLGKPAEAAAELEPLERAAQAKDADAATLRRGAQAVILLGRLQAVSADRWQRAADWLGEARQRDRLDPEVPRIEGQLLIERNNRPEGVPALQQALALDPRDSDTWFALGQAALGGFDFDSTARASESLRLLNPSHPLADLLDAERFLLLEDVDRADAALDGLLAREPDMPEALAMQAAAASRHWDEQAVEAHLAAMDTKFPGQALGAATTGRLLSLNRQYAWAERMLRRAIERRPNWSEPRSELGQLLMQAGRDDDARKALKEAAALDPFDKRSAFGQFLLDTMADYRTIDTPHFRIRVKPGVDEVVAEGMPDALEAMHRDVTGRFGHEPAQRTTIEVLPDHEFFGVRITGMPGIHTMAASTGPVIAMEVPRTGNPRKHLGTFDWLEVLRHEYTHTVTLSQTGNRIPHWLTEALAVSMETKPRSLQTCELLARSLATGKLFTLDRIKWAFVRPETPQDRPLGYAQGRWMVQFIEETWGKQVIAPLLERYRLGDDEDAAMQAVLHIGADAFFERFLEWAKGQVKAWGMDPEPSLDALVDQAREADADLREKAGEARLDRVEGVARTIAGRAGAPARAGEPPFDAKRWPAPKLPQVKVTDALLDGWLSEHPEHPDLLEMKIRRRLAEQPEVNETTRELLKAYAAARPVDPYPDRVLAAAARASGKPEDGLPNLRRLDLLEESDPSYALELARLLRAAGDTAGASASVEKAVRIDGYDPAARELAAAIAIEAGRMDVALRHLHALQRLEPDQPRHAERVKRLEQRMQKSAPPSPAKG
jgi:Flp pilus assembly protein TadD